MNHSSVKFTKLLATTALLLATTACGYDGTMAPYTSDNHDVVRDSNGQIVHSTNGNCVRTQWLSDTDACPMGNEIVQAEKIVFFEFNRSNLTPKAQSDLNALAQALKANQTVKEVKIVGYADRIGSSAYNEKLSQKRAETVRNYLLAKGYANARVVDVRWVGESKPSTNCPAKASRAKQISCLKGDRRVEVEVEYLNKE